MTIFSTVGLREKRKTILLVDTDPQFRASLRKALEAAYFSVGEACNGREGERTALRIKPDAILVDLMLDTIEDGILFAMKLREMGLSIPVYLVSNAADALLGAINYHNLGISGVFIKPVDAHVVIQTLLMRMNEEGLPPSPSP